MLHFVRQNATAIWTHILASVRTNIFQNDGQSLHANVKDLKNKGLSKTFIRLHPVFLKPS